MSCRYFLLQYLPDLGRLLAFYAIRALVMQRNAIVGESVDEIVEFGSTESVRMERNTVNSPST